MALLMIAYSADALADRGDPQRRAEPSCSACPWSQNISVVLLVGGPGGCAAAACIAER